MRWTWVNAITPILLLAKKKIKHTLEDSLRYEFLFVCLDFCFCFSLQCGLIVNSQRPLHSRTLAYNIATLIYSALKKLKNKAVVSKAMYPFQKLRKITKELTWC